MSAASVLIVGDSIANGYPDSDSFVGSNPNSLILAGGGFINRALRGKAGLLNIAISGDTGAAFSGVSTGVLDGSFRRLQWSRYATHAIEEYARNDLSASKTLAQCQSYRVAIWRQLAYRGLRTWVTTCLPRTTSTDSWFTTANQTAHSSESVRVALNDWIRAGAPLDPSTFVAVAVGTSGALLAGQPGHPVVGYIDAADAAETARNSGLWRVPRIVTDAAMTSGSNVFNSASAALTSADVGRVVIVRGAGSAGADTFNIQVQTRNSGTQAVMTGTAGTTVSGATAGIGVYTRDGIHPNSGGCMDMALAINWAPFLAS